MLPELHFTDSITIPTYFVFLSLLVTALILALPKYANQNKMDLPTALNISLILMIVGFVGARLFHVFYEEWPLYSTQPERIFYVWLGGFVFLGGAIPAVLAASLYLKLQKLEFAPWADFFAPLGALGYGFGRLSCFLSGCCYGKICELPWSVNGRHPTQIYALLWEISVALILILNKKIILSRFAVGGVFWIWVFLHALGRVAIESLRDDFRGAFIFGLSISTILALVLLSLSLSQLILGFTLRLKK